MNGPYASDDNIDNPQLTEYSIGKVVIYAAVGWSCSEYAHKAVRNLACKYRFLRRQCRRRRILFPGEGGGSIAAKKSWWKIWKEHLTIRWSGPGKRRNLAAKLYDWVW
jgi:hypothetical protein